MFQSPDDLDGSSLSAFPLKFPRYKYRSRLESLSITFINDNYTFGLLFFLFVDFSTCSESRSVHIINWLGHGIASVKKL